MDETAVPLSKVEVLERAFGSDLNNRQFIPYIMLHEFEALLFADPSKLDWVFLEHEKEIGRLVDLRSEFKSPEFIDDGTDTAPSKRIISQIPEYGARKASAGPLVAEKIGLPTLRAECGHFAQWLKRLEVLSK